MKISHILSRIVLPLLVIYAVSGCVSTKQMSELQDNYDKCEESRKFLSSENTRMEKELAEANDEIERLSKRVKDLASDTARQGMRFRQMMYQYDRLRKTNEELIEKQGVLRTGSEAENRKLMAELLKTQERLQNKEDSLKLLDYDLAEKQKKLVILENELLEREARVKELEQLLAQKDNAVKQLKDRLKEALIGFEDKGLSVEIRNGRVYVSMEAKLLFASGSTAVSEEGKKAVIQLAKALQDEKDLTVLVEGHTDTDKLKGTGAMKDNWDLSVLRATAVVRIMLANSSIDPAIVEAAGRGEYMPVASNDTPEGKAKNRRIEVILTPNLDKLFELLENPDQN